MRRREFITLFAGLAAVLPLGEPAQQPMILAAFRQGLNETGFIEAKT